MANVVIAPHDHDCKTWHHHFVHADFSKLLDLHRHGLVHGMDLKACPHMGICEFCALGKPSDEMIADILTKGLNESRFTLL